MKWKGILKKYRDMNSGRAGLEKDLRAMFGVSLVWLGKKDEPYGYQLVDLNNKKVYDGYKILNIKKLVDFMTPEEHQRQIELLIDKCLRENPYVSTLELNKRLRRLGAYVRKDSCLYGRRHMPLDAKIINILSRNNKIAWRQSFKPASEAEIRLLCKFTNFDLPNLLKAVPAEPERYKGKELADLYPILTIRENGEKLRTFKEAGYIAVKNEDGVFVLNMNRNVILDMSKSGLPEDMYLGLLKKDATDSNLETDRPGQKNTRKEMPTVKWSGGYRSGQNREWEVGKKDKDRDDRDQSRGVSY